ncbi:ketoacyl-ACP synthase III family protein [Spirillospora sp. NPDC048911]|uniref:ketoacyl-ACP synthase III family protein n=1 Tax=Spirillospora sp. NPDC048911 TaxID=3364527 RepID=UPI003718E54B
MRFKDVWIAGTGGALGELVPIGDAIRDGSYSPEEAESTGTVSVSQADQAPPELAVTAGRQAIKQAAELGTDVGPGSQHLHSHGHFQGLEMWPADCWIARELIGETPTRMPLTVSAASNGSTACLEVAASMLDAQPALPSALITIGDRFAPPVDRWHLSPGMVFGDGAAAAVVTRGTGRLRLVSLVSEADTVLEGLSRGDEPFHTTPHLEPDTRRRTREFLAHGGLSLRDVRRRSAARTVSVAERALAEAGTSLDRIDWFVAPFVGRALYRDSFVRPFGSVPEQTLLELGLTIGHLGPADQIYALHHLVKENLLQPGDRVLTIGTGMGFTFSAAVFQAK